DEGSKGLFGLFGSRLAKVRLTVKEQEEDLLASLTEEKPAKKPARKPAEKKEKAEPKQEKPKAEKAEKPAEKKPAPEKKEKAPKQPKQEKPKAEKAEKPATEKKPLPPKAPAKPIEKPVVTMLENDQVEADSAAGKAQAFLKELTHLMGVEVDVAVGNDAEGNVFVKMTGDTLGILIGRRGETLDALQYLTSLKINRGQEGYTRVTLDTENYRAKREDTLIRLANRMANRAVKTGRKVSLEPMNPYERRIIHSALQANEAVDTHSEGDEPNRHVVITLRK
ncbi:MAG: protein jag, partial [Clostridia bacterium]|nr:protein jag [Clostridia bacterium]